MKYELRNFTYFNNLAFDWKVANDRIVLDDFVSEGEIIPSFSINLFTSALGFSVIHNQIDNQQFPTTGTYSTYSFEESGLFGALVKKLFNTLTFSYFKVTTLNKIFFDLSEKNEGTSVLGGKLVVGNIFQYGENNFTIYGQTIGASLVPNDANYVIGGSASMRGWKAGTLGANVNGTIGGGFIIDGSIEHRTKPFSKSKNSLIRDLGFASFFDCGNVWDGYKNFRLDNIAMSIGAGIRYYTIVGAFRFDLGFKLYDPGAPDKQWLFQNDIGTIFKSGEKMQIQFGIGNTF
jgi:outer membrane protein assembly factor BamA